MGGFDFVKDDENLTSTSFNRFDDRVKYMTKLRDKAEKETGEKKSAVPQHHRGCRDDEEACRSCSRSTAGTMR